MVCFHWRVSVYFTRASLLCAAGLTRRRWTLCLIHLLAHLSHHVPPTTHSKAQHNCLSSISFLCDDNGWLMLIQYEVMLCLCNDSILYTFYKIIIDRWLGSDQMET